MTRRSAVLGPRSTGEALQHVVHFCHGQRQAITALIAETVAEWSNDKVPRLSASLAFYTLLSLAPLLVVMVAVAALVFGKQAAQGQLAWHIRGLLGRDGARAIQAFIQSSDKPAAGVLATCLSLLTLVLGASTIVIELRDALNTIWHVPLCRRTTGFDSIISLVRERFYAVAIVLGLGFILFASLVLSAWTAAIGRFYNSVLPIPELALHLITLLLSFLVLTFLFGTIYKLLPDIHLEWGDVIVGACGTSLLFSVGKLLVGIYLGKAGVASTYGAVGSAVIALVWVYYSAQLFFLGAEFTKVYAKNFGSQYLWNTRDK